MSYPPPLERSFYDRDVVQVSQALLGRRLIRESPAGTTVGRIVEVEAYLPANDSACHAAKGKTRRNASMFGPPGHAYVYAIHSRWCLNFVTEPEDVGCAVLIRAVEPLEGLDLMRSRRGRERPLELARGPGRLCEAFGIDRALDGWDLTLGKTLWVTGETTPLTKSEVVGTSPRIGVTSAHDLLLRYFIAGSPWVSGKKSLHHMP